MAIPITIPRLGWNMEVGAFAGWLKRDGERVRPGEMLFRLEGDKATEEIECFDDGILRIPADGPEEGDTVAVGALIGWLVEEGEEIPARESATREPAAPARVDAPALAGAAGSQTREPSPTRAITPRARRAARDLGIDPTTLTGSGCNGRVRERDVRAAAGDSDSIAVTPLRRAVAERLVAAVRDAAPVTLTTTVDATELARLRTRLKAEDKPAPSFTDLIVICVAAALPKHPLLNAKWAGERIAVSKSIHVGVAVDTPAGLLVPVLRDVPSLSLRELAARARDVIERARAGKLTAAELRGGTFTITNLGALGIDAFTPILHDGQSAILGVGRIRREPAVVGDRIEIRDRLTLSLTFDHRVLDGAPAARFLQALGSLIEKPEAGL
jgi:pyruvate dehydrogenase E2 component (dihydrolipoamide acetyltransferase)